MTAIKGIGMNDDFRGNWGSCRVVEVRDRATIEGSGVVGGWAYLSVEAPRGLRLMSTLAHPDPFDRTEPTPVHDSRPTQVGPGYCAPGMSDLHASNTDQGSFDRRKVDSMMIEGFNLARHVADDPERVEHRRRRLRAVLPAAPVWLEQVHGIEVFDADEHLKPDVIPRADAAITTSKGRVCLVMTADCLPIVIGLANQADGPICGLAVIHAGWRGLVSGVVEAAMQALQAKLQRAGGSESSSRPGYAQSTSSTGFAWIGPAISQSAFEVGPEVREAFIAKHADDARSFAPGAAFGSAPEKGERYWADLPALAQRRLHALGIETVIQSGICSFRDPRFFSHRRHAKTGRFATIAWLE